MDETPRLIPIWLWIAVIVIIVFLCSSCRGGRSLGKGSAGTVIVPQTPQEINERNRQPPPKIALPPLEPLPPVTIIPASPTPPAVPAKAVRSTPTLPESKSVEANPIVVNPKAAGELKPFSPSVSSSPELITSPAKNPPTDNKATVSSTPELITPPAKNLPTDNKATRTCGTPVPPVPPVETESFSWVELLSNYILFILIALLIWTIYDIVKTKRNSDEIRHKNGVKKTVRKKRKPITRKKK